MVNDYKFNKLERIKFYFSYFFYKIFAVLFEVKKNRAPVFFYEILFILHRILFKRVVISPFSTKEIETVFGKFKLRPKTLDMLSASPAYERRDVNYLLKLISKKIKSNKNIAFLDIGADFGYYSIVVGNKFKNSNNLTVYAFEPFIENYNLMLKNIKLNDLNKKIKTYNLALTNKENVKYDFKFDPNCPGSSCIIQSNNKQSVTIKGTSLDSILKKELNKFDVVFFKIDVEGHELFVLEGAKSILKDKQCILLIEDFVDNKIISFLNKNNFKFKDKLTTYNSWWTKNFSNSEF